MMRTRRELKILEKIDEAEILENIMIGIIIETNVKKSKAEDVCTTNLNFLGPDLGMYLYKFHEIFLTVFLINSISGLDL